MKMIEIGKLACITQKEPTRIMCVGTTEVEGWKNIAETANAQNLRQFHPLPLPRYMPGSQNVGLVKYWQIQRRTKLQK